MAARFSMRGVRIKLRRRKRPAKRLPDATLQALIHAEQISTLYRVLPTSISGNMAGALMLSALLIGELPANVILGWLACITLFQSWRLGLFLQSRAAGFRFENVNRAAAIWAGVSCTAVEVSRRIRASNHPGGLSITPVTEKNISDRKAKAEA